ncbi:MAG: hypothetical protein GF401_19460 [Chitinivibrionales bacterium]|nr:hypothetical protein [Chitinivibrionales bacterium]
MSRELKGFPDIVQLMTVDGIDPKEGEVREIFAKYNSEDLYRRVLDCCGVMNEK